MSQCAQIVVGKTFIIWTRTRELRELYRAIRISCYGDFLGREPNKTNENRVRIIVWLMLRNSNYDCGSFAVVELLFDR